jgi:hypothetical protein
MRGEEDPIKKMLNPIKKFIMNIFKIKEIDNEKFRKESKWAIRPLIKRIKNNRTIDTYNMDPKQDSQCRQANPPRPRALQ